MRWAGLAVLALVGLAFGVYVPTSAVAIYRLEREVARMDGDLQRARTYGQVCRDMREQMDSKAWEDRVRQVRGAERERRRALADQDPTPLQVELGEILQ